MNTINDIRLEVIGFGSVPASVDEQRAIARELISLRAQVAELRGQEPALLLLKIDDDPDRHRRLWMEVSETLGFGTPFYSRPVPPAASQHVPDEIPETPDADAEVDAYNKGKTDGWNACRAAMLQISPVQPAVVTAEQRLEALTE